jgi:hypothetical protein
MREKWRKKRMRRLKRKRKAARKKWLSVDPVFKCSTTVELSNLYTYQPLCLVSFLFTMNRYSSFFSQSHTHFSGVCVCNLYTITLIAWSGQAAYACMIIQSNRLPRQSPRFWVDNDWLNRRIAYRRPMSKKYNWIKDSHLKWRLSTIPTLKSTLKF